MRISSNQMAENDINGISNAYAKFNTANTQISTGKRVQNPSDDPSGVAQSLGFREKISETDQYKKNMGQAKGFLATSETALDSVTSLLRQARTYAVQGANDSTSQATREGLAGQVQNIIDQVANLGNTSYGSRYVFAGQRTDHAPFQGSGAAIAYTGGAAATGDGSLIYDVGRSEPMTVNATGDTTVLPVVQTLQKLHDDLLGGSSNVISNVDIANIDTQLTNLIGVRADMGAKVQRIDLTTQRDAQVSLNYTQYISDIEDTDIPKAVVDMQTAQTAYQAALQATSRSFQYSLLDFIK